MFRPETLLDTRVQVESHRKKTREIKLKATCEAP